LKSHSWRLGALAVLIFVTRPALAHPHIFIDYTATVLCDQGRVSAVRFSWTFDEMYSASLYHDYTSKPVGPLTPLDVQQLDKGAFEDSKEEHYFIDMTLNGKPATIGEAKDFDASWAANKITYYFTVPVPADAQGADNVLEFAPFDTEFYIDYEPAKRDAVTIKNAGTLKIACAPEKVTKNTTTFGPMETTVIRCRYGAAA
jgi:ABC-type uncharacterized transport system substrate-binding protein